MNDHSIGILIDSSGSMKEMGKYPLAAQIVKDLAEFLEVREINGDQKEQIDLWITDGHESGKSTETLTLLIGCDKPRYNLKGYSIFTLEDFPLLVERLIARSSRDE